MGVGRLDSRICPRSLCLPRLTGRSVGITVCRMAEWGKSKHVGADCHIICDGYLQTQTEHPATSGGNRKPFYFEEKQPSIEPMNVTVLGAGAWGTALSLVLRTGNHRVTLWGHRKELLDEIRISGENRAYLPGVPFPSDINIEPSLEKAAETASTVILAVPSKAMRTIGSQLRGLVVPLVSVTKGIEFNTGLTMSSVLRECVPDAPVATLSGPSLAMEVALKIPTAVVAASEHPGLGQEIQSLFHRAYFRVYTSRDLHGVELAGALKNVIAIGAGVCDGLGLGDNAKAALITRAIVEMRRLGVACGAQSETFSGLSGLGDLTVTCFSKLSRNRSFGERLGKGETVENLLESLKTVAEGYPTARAAWQLATKHGVETPIMTEVYSMLYEGKNLQDALRDLTLRESKSE